MRKLIILTVLFFALILLSTSVLAINFNSLFTSLFDYFFPSPPKIISAKVEPIKVEPSDWMEIIAEVEDKYGVKSVFADMAGIEKVELKLIYGDEKKGVWRGRWFVHSIEVGKSYNATIVAINERRKTSNVNVEFHDDPIFCCRRMVNITGSQGWAYRRPVTIDNMQNSNTLTDYQVLVTLDTGSLISAGKMRNDCGDIRFTDSDGITLLNYWIESGCNSANTKIWVKVPNIPASSTKTIYVYYGNPDATSLSNKDSVFVKQSDSVTKSCQSSTTGGTCSVSFSPSDFGYSGYVFYDVYVNLQMAGDLSQGGAVAVDGTCTADSESNERIIVYYNNICVGYYSTGHDDCTLRTPSNWPKTLYVNSGSLSFVSDATSGINLDPLSCGFYFKTVYNITIAYFRKYTSPEPTTSVGNEESIAVVTLDTASLISQGKMRSDCGDIRFTDSRSFDAALWTVNFSYQLVSGCGSTNTIFRVNVTPISPITIGKTFYVYYGNPEVTTLSTSLGGIGNWTTTLLPEETWIRISGGTVNLLITGGGGNLTIK